MPDDQLFIGVDSGTQGTKAVVFSREQGKIIAEAYAEHQIIETQEGRREQEPIWWIEAFTAVIGKVLKESYVSKQLIRAIGVSGQQHGMVALDLDGNVIRPAKLWCDTETSQQCIEMTQKIGSAEKVIELIGNSIAAGFTASKILWLKNHEPENYGRLATVLLPHDYINFWLTGEMKTEFGDASGTAYFDVRTRTWSKAILDVIDDSGKLQDCLPELIPSDAPVGNIRAEIAEQFQLNPDVLVSSGGGDNMMAAIGTGNVTPGIVTASLGTSGTIYSFSNKPIIDRNGELAAFCSSTGGWLPLVCTMNVTVSTELTRELLRLSVSDLNKTASTAELGAGGILLLPYFNGERTPALPTAKAVFFGLTSTNYNPRNLARASMEGATFGLRYGLDVLKQLGINPSEIRLVGGGAKSPLWRQMVADVFNCPVVCPKSSEAGAVGAALQAMWCYLRQKEGNVSISKLTDQYIALDETTRTEPDASNASRYADIYQHYLRLNNTIKPLF
ncbi:MAG: xylulokinase [Desulfobacterales bacterium]|jgi:D-xylulose kinase